MTQQQRAAHRRARILVVSLGSIILLVALSVASASADWTTIDTNDGQIDPGWGDPVYSDECTFTERQLDEIKNGWVKWDGEQIYFRIETCAAPPLTPATPLAKMRAIGAIDCNGNGEFDDPDMGGANGDRLVTYYDENGAVWLLSGAGGPVINLDNTHSEEVPLPPGDATSIEWRMPIQYLYPDCRASLESLQVTFATVEVRGTSSTRIDPPPEVTMPDTFTWHNPMDYGDLPNPNPAMNTCEQYSTRIPCDGPRHGVVAGAAILGAEIDPDGGGLHDSPAMADDVSDTGSVDDEDGVVPTTAVAWSSASGGSLDVTISGGSGYLSCWIDWNDDDDFADSGEKVIDDVAVSAGSLTQAVSVPVDPYGVYYGRCRVSPSTGASTTGPIYGGEVEDHRWLPQTSDLTISQAMAITDVDLSWADLSASDGYNLFRSASPYFKPDDAGVSLLPGSPFAGPPVTDAGVLGDATDDNYFYLMTKTRTLADGTVESVPSNEVGLFEFALVPGTP